MRVLHDDQIRHVQGQADGVEVEPADVCRVPLEGPVDLRLGVTPERFVDQEYHTEDDGEHEAEHRAYHEPSARDATNVAEPRP